MMDPREQTASRSHNSTYSRPLATSSRNGHSFFGLRFLSSRELQQGCMPRGVTGAIRRKQMEDGQLFSTAAHNRSAPKKQPETGIGVLLAFVTSVQS